MEPMTLGSPTHSPSSPMNFLPPYLMGEFHQPITPRAGSRSPTKGRTLAFGNSPPTRTTPQAPQYSTPLLQKTANDASFSNKPNGPPTQGLFDTIHQPEWSGGVDRHSRPPPTPFTSPTQQAQGGFYPGVFSPEGEAHSFLGDPGDRSYLKSRLRAMQSHEESYDVADAMGNFDRGGGGDEENEHWVTVFGFPSSAANLILTQFSNCGSILEKKFPPQGNWAWLRFASRSETGRALALNGRVLSGGVMIGVLLCSQPPNQANASMVNRSGARQLAVGPPRLQNTSIVSPNSSTTGAQRSSGAISRALEYVFGW